MPVQHATDNCKIDLKNKKNKKWKTDGCKKKWKSSEDEYEKWNEQ